MLAGLQLFGSAISAFSAIQQGKAAKTQAYAEAQQYKAERQMNELQTQQRHNDRLASYNSALATNEAWFAFAGRDASDRSVRAFLDRQKEIAYTDLSRSATQGFMESEKLRYQSDLSILRGRNAYRAGMMSAASSITSGLFKYQQIKGV